jgi:hypothetical protein
MTHIVAIDPGKNSGFCHAVSSDETFQIISISKLRPIVTEPHVVACELPALRAQNPRDGRRKIDPRTVVTLALRAGFAAGRASASTYVFAILWLPVKTWKDATMRDGSRITKKVHQNRLVRDLGLPDWVSSDEIDACGIAYATHILRAWENPAFLKPTR